MSEAASPIKAVCSSCGGERNCGIRGEFQERGGDQEFSWNVTWRILQCLGCDHVFVRTQSTNSEDYENYYEADGSAAVEYNIVYKYWPAQLKRRMPDWLVEFSLMDGLGDLEAALIEVYGALNNDLGLLAAIGMRTSFDIAAEMLDVEPEQSFKQKLAALVSKSHLAEVDKSRVETLVEAGSASIHRGWRPTAQELKTMMDVLEYFVQTTFVDPARRKKLDEEAQNVRVKVPSRKRAQSKSDGISTKKC